MNAEERQALRERHAEEYGLCVYCFVPDTYNGRVGEWMPAVYPCDIIKVLDATEPPVTECDHMTGVEVGVNSARFVYASERLGNKPWNYCPKCGEKL